VRMTPLDIQSHHFKRRFSGVDPAEVESFLRMVADDYAGVLAENQALGEANRRLENQVKELSANESLLKETLISAQALSEELRRGAVRESEMLLQEAGAQAEKTIDAANRRAARISEDIRGMKTLRSRIAASVRAVLETHLSLVDELASASDDETAFAEAPPPDPPPHA